MSSHDVKEYIALYEFLKTPTDKSVEEQVKAKMERLWYYYLNPTDKKVIYEYIAQQEGNTNV